MTLDEFFVALEATRDMGWTCNAGVVRAKTDDLINFCPITAVAWDKLGEFYDSASFLQAAEVLGLDALAASNIAVCADGIGAKEFWPEEYKRLFAALGLPA